MGVLDWLGLGSSSGETRGPAGMPFDPQDEGAGYGLGSIGAALEAGQGYMQEAAKGALPGLMTGAALGALDGLMEDAPGKGDLFIYHPPGTDPKTGKATPREFSVTPLGWGALAGLGVLVWLTTR